VKKLQIKKFFVMYLIVFILSFTSAMPIFAAASNQVDLKWVTQQPTNDVFGNVTIKLEEIGQSGYHLVFRLGQIACVIVMAIIGVNFMITKDKTALKETKGWMGNLLIGVVVVFAGSFLLEMIIGIATNLTPTVTP